MRFLLAIAILAFASTTQVQAQAPAGPPPIFKIVAAVNPAQGHIEFRDVVFKTEYREEIRKVLIDGQEVNQVVKVTVKLPVVERSIILAGTSQIITPDGKPIAMADLWKRVKANTVVVLSGNHDVPDAAYLRALHPEAVVIVPAPAKGRPK